MNRDIHLAKEYLKLLRVKHYIKNLLIFVPLFFSLSFYNIYNVLICVKGFLVFSILSSIVYVLNDLKDVEKDRLHDKKRGRPLAAGTISRENAKKLIFVLLILWIGAFRFMNSSGNMWLAAGVLIAYLAANIAYSFGAKNIPVMDIVLLSSGYVLRVIFGGIIINVSISYWLYLMITLCAFYLGLGKRRNEIITQGTGTREVLKGYSYNFLDKNMYVCQTLCVVFYSFWSVDSSTVQRLNTHAFVFTVPVVFLILLKYSLNIERDSEGDPIDVLLQDKALCVLVGLYVVMSVIIVCLGRVS